MSPAFVPVGVAHGAGSLPRFWSGPAWGFIGAAALALFIVVPICNLAVPAGSVFHVSDYMAAPITGPISVPRPPTAVQIAISIEFAGDISLGLMMPTWGT